MINRFILVGRITKYADLRYSQSGTSTANFLLAVNRQSMNQSEEREADSIN